MRELRPHISSDKETVGVNKNSLFVQVTDFNHKLLLRQIKVSAGQHHWCWIDLHGRGEVSVDLSDLGDRYSSFDNALNRAVNDPYSTVYECDSLKEMVQNWPNVIYSDNIGKVYKGTEID